MEFKGKEARISDQPETKHRKPTSYKAVETGVTLYGIDYRAIVVHSEAHDRRRTKRADKELQKELMEMTGLTKNLEESPMPVFPMPKLRSPIYSPGPIMGCRSGSSPYIGMLETNPKRMEAETSPKRDMH